MINGWDQLCRTCLSGARLIGSDCHQRRPNLSRLFVAWDMSHRLTGIFRSIRLLILGC